MQEISSLVLVLSYFQLVNGNIFSTFDTEFLQKSRRILQFPNGSNLGIKNAIVMPLKNTINIDNKIEFSHTVGFLFAKLYTEIGEKDRMDVVPGYYADEELLPKLSTLGYSAQGKKSSGSSAQNNVSLSDAEKSERLFDEALKRDRLRSRIERMFIYKDLESFLDKMGLPGRICLLRTICEVAEEPFESTLFGEILNTILTASLGGQPVFSGENLDYNTYVEAEVLGRTSGNCHEQFGDCPNSVFSLLQNLLEDFIG